MLSDIEREKPYTFILLYTKDDRIYDLVTDELLKVYRIRKDSLQKPDNREELNAKQSLGHTMPLGLARWLFACDNDKLYIDKKTVEALITTTTATFLIKTSDYKSFNILQRMFQGVQNTLILSTGFIRRDDAQWLMERTIKKIDNYPNLRLQKFIFKGYSMYPIKLMDIFEASNIGKLTRTAEITTIVGLPNNTQESFILKLLEDPPETAKGLKAIMRNRALQGYELGEQVTYRALRGYLKKTVKDMLEIKTLVLTGQLYKDISKVEGLTKYQINNLRRYNKSLVTIKEIPVSRLITLLQCLDTTPVWYSELDLLNFLYSYFYTILKGEIIE